MLVHEIPMGMPLNNGDQSFQQLNVECVPSSTACPMEVRGCAAQRQLVWSLSWLLNESCKSSFKNSLGNCIFVRYRKGSSILFTQDRLNVYLTTRSEGDLKELRSNGFAALYLEVNDSSSINSCVLSLLHNCKYGVRVLINNAGIVIPGLVEDLSRKYLS